MFIGTGYGAMQWLTAPEPVRTVTVTKKTAPKAPKPAVESDAAENQAVARERDVAGPAETVVALRVQQEPAKTPGLPGEARSLPVRGQGCGARLGRERCGSTAYE